MKTIIFNFEDYKGWLQCIINTKTAKNGQFSINRFAQKLGMSQSLLSLILNHKRNLSIKTALKIADYLKLNTHETKYLLLLVEKKKTKSQKQLNSLQKELNELKKRAFTEMQSNQSKRPFAAWYYNLLLAATALHSITRTAKGLSDYLGLKIEDVQAALDLIEHLKLVKKKESEYIFVENGMTFLPENVQKHSKWKISKTILENAQLKFESNHLAIDVIDGQIIATNATQVEIAKKKINQFMNEIQEILFQGERNILVQYSFQLFEAE